MTVHAKHTENFFIDLVFVHFDTEFDWCKLLFSLFVIEIYSKEHSSNS